MSYGTKSPVRSGGHGDCSKCVIHSKLGYPDNWSDRRAVPTLAAQMVTHGRMSEAVPEVQAIIDADNKGCRCIVPSGISEARASPE